MGLFGMGMDLCLCSLHSHRPIFLRTQAGCDGLGRAGSLRAMGDHTESDPLIGQEAEHSASCFFRVSENRAHGRTLVARAHSVIGRELVPAVFIFRSR